MPTQGVVVKFDARKGYGFIRIAGSDHDAFVHVSDVRGRVDLVPGQRLFRHKTIKGSFQVVFWLIAFLQIALIAAWLWCWKERPAWIPDILRFLFPRS